MIIVPGQAKKDPKIFNMFSKAIQDKGRADEEPKEDEASLGERDRA